MDGDPIDQVVAEPRPRPAAIDIAIPEAATAAVLDTSLPRGPHAPDAIGDASGDEARHGQDEPAIRREVDHGAAGFPTGERESDEPEHGAEAEAAERDRSTSDTHRLVISAPIRNIAVESVTAIVFAVTTQRRACRR